MPLRGIQSGTGVTRLPMSGPLTTPTINALENLATTNSSYAGPKNTFINHSKTTLSNISKAIAAVNESLLEQRRHVAKLRRRAAAEDNEEAQEALKDAENDLEKLLEEAMRGIESGEQATRQMVDLLVDAEDYDGALKRAVQDVREVVEATEERRRDWEARRQADLAENGEVSEETERELEAEEEEEARNVEGIKEKVARAATASRQHWLEMTTAQRYRDNNEYAMFRRVLHRSIFDETSEVPDKRRWFDEEGAPVLYPREMLLGEEETAMGDDEDLVIAKVKLDFKCPLSMRDIEIPYSGRGCKHTYEKTTVLEYVRQNGDQAACAVVGCPAKLKMNELHLNEEMQAMIEKRKRRQMEGTESEEDGEQGEYAVIEDTVVDPNAMDED